MSTAARQQISLDHKERWAKHKEQGYAPKPKASHNVSGGEGEDRCGSESALGAKMKRVE